ncbi:hypothetical protein D3C84_578110 [compost metagenome]
MPSHDPAWLPARTSQGTRLPVFFYAVAGNQPPADNWPLDCPAWPSVSTTHGPTWDSSAHPGRPDTSSPPAAPPFPVCRHPPPGALIARRPVSSSASPLDNPAWRPNDWPARIAPCPGLVLQLDVFVVRCSRGA